MRYWWVNQNQTFRQETEGGFLWSPKRKTNGCTNPFYEFMREVSPGDLVFSFNKTLIQAIGIARSHAYPSPKPANFFNEGRAWNDIGWRVDVDYVYLNNQIKPKDHIHYLRGFFPEKYAPLQKTTGNGNQGVYLTSLPPMLAERLINLIGQEATFIRSGLHSVAENPQEIIKDTAEGLVEWEEHLVKNIYADEELPSTERESLVMARRGQGVFKERVMHIEKECRITKVRQIEHLRASHIKPWRDCDDARERLEGSNGLLLTPTIDHLFDRGFISFENDGKLLISPVADEKSLNKMGVKTETECYAGQFNDDQKYFLNYHREQIFLEAKVTR